MQVLVAFLLLTIGLGAVHPDAKADLRKQRYATSACDSSVTYDKVLLKRLTLLSKYVFTGKVYAVTTGHNETRVYKVNIRRVLKGDLSGTGFKVKFGTPKSLRFSDATVLVESTFRSPCPPLRVRNYGIFLTEKKKRKGTIKLNLVVEPIILTLRSIDIVEAVVKGKERYLT